MSRHRSRHRASATWSGPVGSGEGVMQLGKRGPKIDYTVDSRMNEEAGTNPEQMLGAAHAGCFAMSLTNLIEEAGFDAKDVEIHADAVVHLEGKDEGFRITQIDLTAKGRVPGMDEEAFRRLANQAKETCPVSKLFQSADINLEAELD